MEKDRQISVGIIDAGYTEMKGSCYSIEMAVDTIAGRFRQIEDELWRNGFSYALSRFMDEASDVSVAAMRDFFRSGGADSLRQMSSDAPLYWRQGYTEALCFLVFLVNFNAALEVADVKLTVYKTMKKLVPTSRAV